jgi:hypothetical protein
MRYTLSMFVVAVMAARAQSPNDTPKVDRATAYYHYTLAHLYFRMAAAAKGGNREYEEKAIENYKAAVKADPQTPPLRTTHPMPMVIWPAHRLPPARQDQSLPRVDPQP